MALLDALARPQGVVELGRRPRLTQVRAVGRVAGAFVGGHGDIVDPYVVRMHVAALILGIGHDDVGPVTADHGHQPGHRLVQIGPGEAVGMVVGLRSLHARVAIAEHLNLFVADDLRSSAQLLGPHLGQLLGHRGIIQGRVEDLALLSPGAAHEHGADALGVVAGHRGRALGRLVIGMGMHGEEAEPFRRSRHGW